ncbi:O-fucosyltransferase 30-like protein, partial [Drosera capensis]
GFSNQVSEFNNAIVIASILNWTVVVPPVLVHHAVALGSCPEFRVLGANEIRWKVWESAIEMLRSGRYVSLAHILDLSALPSVVQTIDFREFVSIWCGTDLNHACSNDPGVEPSVLDALRQYGSLLSGFNGNVDECLYAVDEDCRTTV